MTYFLAYFLWLNIKRVAEIWSPQDWELTFRRLMNDWEIPRLTELF